MHIFHLVHNSSRLRSFVHILLQQKAINNIEIHIQLQPADCASILCQQLRLVFYLLYMVYDRNKKLQQEAGCAAIAQKTSDIYVYVYVCRLTHIHTYRLHIIYKYMYILKRMYLYKFAVCVYKNAQLFKIRFVWSKQPKICYLQKSRTIR